MNASVSDTLFYHALPDTCTGECSGIWTKKIRYQAGLVTDFVNYHFIITSSGPAVCF
jgi:hypothetical protein